MEDLSIEGVILERQGLFTIQSSPELIEALPGVEFANRFFTSMDDALIYLSTCYIKGQAKKGILVELDHCEVVKEEPKEGDDL